MNDRGDWIRPDWVVPENVHAVSTTRTGGFSKPPFESLNLGYHRDEDPDAVGRNRQHLAKCLSLPCEPSWLQQVHGNRAVAAESVRQSAEPVAADASFARGPDAVCVVMTADCLPVFLADRAGTQVAVAHAGWRGLASGIIASTVSQLDASPDTLLAWLGPAIGSEAYEVGDEVREAFIALGEDETDCFQPSPAGRWRADLYGLASAQLRREGIHSISGGDFCTYSDRARFFSYRRDGSAGRMANLIWLTKPHGTD